MSVELHPRAEQSWRLLTERAAAESDHRRRVNLEAVARHVREEVRGDVPALMATLVPEPCYEVWGASGSPAPQGHEQVKAFYEASIEIGKNRLEYELSRVVADEDTVLTDGIFRHAYRGDMLVPARAPESRRGRHLRVVPGRVPGRDHLADQCGRVDRGREDVHRRAAESPVPPEQR